MRKVRMLVAPLIVVTLVLAALAAEAAPLQLTKGQLARTLLTLPAVSKASGTGYPAEADAVECGVASQIKANYCYRKYMRSAQAMRAGAPWVTHLNVFSFKTGAEARAYVKKVSSSQPELVAATAVKAMTFNPQGMISDGLRMQPGPEASVFQAVGVNALWSSCGDPSGASSKRTLAQCALAVANVQATQLR